MDVESMSVKELKALITKAGLKFADCPEKSDLKARATEAAERLSGPGFQAAAPESEPQASKKDGKTLAGYDCLVFEAESPDLVVLMLHGFGATNNDFADLPEMLKALLPGKSVAYVMPQAPPGAMGASWWHLDVMKWMGAMQGGSDALAKLIREAPPGLDECRSRMAALLDEICTLTGVTHDKIMIAGFSQGAMTAMDVALNQPPEKALAGVTMLSGAPIVVEHWAERLKLHHEGIKVFVCHGQSDMVLPFVASGWLRDLLQANGAAIQYETHPGGHELGGPAIVQNVAAHWMKCMSQ